MRAIEKPSLLQRDCDVLRCAASEKMPLKNRPCSKGIATFGIFGAMRMAFIEKPSLLQRDCDLQLDAICFL